MGPAIRVAPRQPDRGEGSLSPHSSTDELIDRLRASLADRYAIEREIAHGGMATVFLARDVRHNRRVAVKALHGAFALTIGPERFQREIEIVAGLAHPNIVPLHDSGEASDVLYYVMPFIDGESLRDRIRREGQLPVDHALRIAREVGDALAYAHERGVVHRDIKPANIMIEAGHAVVTDFGVACMTDGASADRLTTSGVSVGTALYMSPEQAGGERNVDGRSDIYSLGCVLYEMLCGDPPFAGYNRQVLLARKMVESPSSVRVVRESVCEAVEQLTLTALARNAADRFDTATEFIRALDEAALQQQHSGPAIRTVGPASRPDGRVVGPPRPRTSPWLIGAGVLLLLTAVGFVTNTVHDTRMQLPPEFVPSRWDFPILGARALLPELLYIFAIVAGFVLSRYGARIVVAILRRVGLRRSIERVSQRTTEAITRIRRRVEPTTVAELFFIGAIVVSIPVVLEFGSFLPDLWTDGTQGLALSERANHTEFTFAMALLVLVLSVLWWRVFRGGRHQGTGAGRIVLARLGSLAWIVLLILIMTAPWRTVWNNELPRVRVNGDRAYIVLERASDLVIYNADRNTTQLYRTGEPLQLVRLNSTGYVFESAGSFERAEAER